MSRACVEDLKSYTLYDVALKIAGHLPRELATRTTSPELRRYADDYATFQ